MKPRVLWHRLLGAAAVGTLMSGLCVAVAAQEIGTGDAGAPTGDLPRGALLGVVMDPPPNGNRPGALVREVMEEHTAAALGIRAGDLIIAAGGEPVTGPDGVVSYAGRMVAGDEVDLTVVRRGSELRLRGVATARPLESYEGATPRYGAVPFDGGKLRDILVLPDGDPEPPVLFLIQGFSCASMESIDPGFPYRRIAQVLADHGIATYRVEKPGVGDSVVGRRHCSEMNFAQEVEAFRTAYHHLIDERGFDPDRVFMLGHSMGGIQGPLLAAERSPRGVAVFGTLLRNWADYHLALNGFQPFLMLGYDPADQLENLERNREIFQRFYFERQSPARIVSERPELEEAVRSTLVWNGEDWAMGRHYSFMQDVAQQRLAAAWRDTRSRVLSLYGEVDVVALADTDHRLIVDIVNHYRPGTGRYVEFPQTDHGMALIGDLAEFRRRAIEAGRPPRGDFNPDVATTLVEWIEESLASPPVRTLP